MAAPLSKILFITVHYKASDGISALLASLQRLERFSSVDVIVVDNASGETELAALRDVLSRYPNVRLIESGANLGYFGAARFAFDRYLEAHSLPDWVIVSNHDVVIQDDTFFVKLFSCNAKSVGMIAPRILALPDHTDANPFMRRRPGWLRWTSLRIIHSAYGMARFWHWLSCQKQALRSAIPRRNDKMGANDRERQNEIYAPHGAFLVFSRQFFESGGFLDGNLFLYFEEVCVAEICRALGIRIIYDPAFCVFHNEHQSIGANVTRFSYECHRRAFRYIRSRYLLRSQTPFESCRPDLVQ